MKYKIEIIGCGVMGTLLAQQLIQRNIAAKKQILCCDHSARATSAIKERLGVATLNEVSGAINASTIILAVKPQHFASVCSLLKDKLTSGQVVISIMAGVSLAALREALGHVNLVRSMPNLAARVGRSVTVWHAPKGMPREQKKFAQQILSALGETLEVQSERLIDAATAISGSGPAYFFYTAEIMESAARKLGFSAADARCLVLETLNGAALTAEQDSRNFRELRTAVTSKKGTTEAALKTLAAGRFPRLWERAIRAAYKRARQLSKIV